MRVIAGNNRRTLLETPDGLETRPTQDRIKETLFNMIGPDVYDSRFLDIFAGSGQMGIEALSRGAEFACFVEKDRKALTAINHNLEKTKLNDAKVSQVISQDIFSSIAMIEKLGPFNLVFMDPPYNNELEKRVLQLISNSRMINEDSLIIVEADKHTDFGYLEEFGYYIERIKEYKTNKHMFIRRK